ncbi:MAG: hypothetical protein KGV50_05555 [Gammaproteobacteria bacterium]|nr:hypothetical protein [Gammaproteobacteria bacterium]
MRKIFFILFLFVFSSHATEYKVTVKGHSAGSARLLISTTQENYKVSLVLLPSMLAKMFGIDNMEDSSSGTIMKGHFYPSLYCRATLDGKKMFSVSFDKGVAKKNIEGKFSEVDINTLGQDPLTQIAQIQYDLTKGVLAERYILITEKTQRTFVTKRIISDTENMVVLTQTPKSDRIIQLWFDDKYSLNRMQKIKRGKIDFDMIIKK